MNSGRTHYFTIPVSEEFYERITADGGILLEGSHTVKLSKRPDGLHDLDFTQEYSY